MIHLLTVEPMPFVIAALLIYLLGFRRGRGHGERNAWQEVRFYLACCLPEASGAKQTAKSQREVAKWQ